MKLTPELMDSLALEGLNVITAARGTTSYEYDVTGYRRVLRRNTSRGTFRTWSPPEEKSKPVSAHPECALDRSYIFRLGGVERGGILSPDDIGRTLSEHNVLHCDGPGNGKWESGLIARKYGTWLNTEVTTWHYKLPVTKRQVAAFAAHWEKQVVYIRDSCSPFHLEAPASNRRPALVSRRPEYRGDRGLMSDEGITGGDIFEIPAAGGEARNLTPGMKASGSWLTWQNGNRILCSESFDGQSALASLDVATGGTSVLWQSEESNSTGGFNGEISLAADQKTAALVLHSFKHPPEVWAGPIGAWKQITHLNTSVRPAWGRAENLRWENQGIPIQGWLLHPLHENPALRYPMLVAVHGGPSSMARPRWPATLRAPYLYNVALLAHEGYFIFYPNPRGSFGQGEAFTQANVKDFGHGDLQDILAGVDQAVRSDPVDPNRIAIAGWSYGGYLAMFAITQTNRFRAAVAGAGIANWQSYYGENRIDQWLIPFFGASVYDDPATMIPRCTAVVLRSRSIKNIKTPTLILVGERDGECPVPQSLEFWHALKTLGVPTQLVVYPGEGHQIVRQDHRRDVVKRTMAWLDQYLGSSGP